MAIAPTSSFFPAIPPLLPTERYSAIIDGARTQYQESYDTNQAKANTIPVLAKEWEERSILVIAGKAAPMPTPDEQRIELNRHVDLYIELRKARDDIKRVRDLYDKTVLKCTPPALDVPTLTCLLRMKVNIPEVKQIYDQLFTTGLKLLQDQRAKISALAEQVVPALTNLRSAEEIYACHVLKYNTLLSSVAYNAQKGTMVSLTPLFTGLVEAREKEIQGLHQIAAGPVAVALQPLAMAAAEESHFPQVPAVEAKDSYQAIIDTLRGEYNKHYASYNAEADKIPGLAAEWDSRTALVIAGKADPMPSPEEKKAELDKYIAQYMAFRKIRDDTKRIRDLYDETIAKCSPPVLDIATLTELQKMGVDVSVIKKTYDQLFTKELGQIKDQRSEVHALAQKISAAVDTLKKAPESYAFHVQGYSTGSLSYQFLRVRRTSSTPLLSQFVEDLEKLSAKTN